MLSDLEERLLRECAAGQDIKSSDRPADRARTRLKKLGYLTFDRAGWRWQITDAGRSALSRPQLDAGTGSHPSHHLAPQGE